MDEFDEAYAQAASMGYTPVDMLKHLEDNISRAWEAIRHARNYRHGQIQLGRAYGRPFSTGPNWDRETAAARSEIARIRKYRAWYGKLKGGADGRT